MRMAATRIVLFAALVTVACGADAPTLPAPAGPPTSVGPAAAPEGHWNVTTTRTSVTGPAAAICIVDPRVGRSTSVGMDVSRSANTLTLLYDTGNDDVTLKGATDGEAFTAGASFPSYLPCGGARVDYQFEFHVAGQFSPDGNAITAKATWTYRLPSGDAVVLSFDWVATRVRLVA